MPRREHGSFMRCCSRSTAYRISSLVAVVSGVVFFIMNAVCGTVEVTVPDPPKKEETTGNPELDKMIRDGNLAISEMKRLNASIKDEKISADIDRLEDLSAKIFAQVKSDPSKLPQIRKFMDYYLPTTLKLLNAYDRMGAQGVSGENIDSDHAACGEHDEYHRHRL